MKSVTTVRRWVKELENLDAHPRLEVYKQGMICALRCVLGPDWPSPATFARFGSKNNKQKK